MKIVLVMMALMLIPSMVLASDATDFLKGNHAEEELSVKIGIAKIIKSEEGADYRIQLDRKSEVDKLRDGSTVLSFIAEF